MTYNDRSLHETREGVEKAKKNFLKRYGGSPTFGVAHIEENVKFSINRRLHTFTKGVSDYGPVEEVIGFALICNYIGSD